MADQGPNQDFRDGLVKAIPGLRAFGMSLSGRSDWADDLVQETLVKAWHHHQSFHEGTNIKAWLYTILRNEYYSQLRKRRREIEDIDGKYSGAVMVEGNQESHLEMANLKMALAKLPPDQREAIILVGASGFSYQETAVICGVAEGTVKSRVSRARERLSILLDGTGNSVRPEEAVKPQLRSSE